MTTVLKEKIAILQTELPQLKKNYGVKNIGIFGSVRHGTHHKKSDIDVMVELKKPIGFFTFIDLENFLKKSLKRKVDLTTKNALKPSIKKSILKDTVYASKI